MDGRTRLDGRRSCNWGAYMAAGGSGRRGLSGHAADGEEGQVAPYFLRRRPDRTSPQRTRGVLRSRTGQRERPSRWSLAIQGNAMGSPDPSAKIRRPLEERGRRWWPSSSGVTVSRRTENLVGINRREPADDHERARRTCTTSWEPLNLSGDAPPAEAEDLMARLTMRALASRRRP
jgi:hypothetical protein